MRLCLGKTTGYLQKSPIVTSFVFSVCGEARFLLPILFITLVFIINR